MSDTTFDFNQDEPKTISNQIGSLTYHSDGHVQFTSANAFVITSSQINVQDQRVYTVAEVNKLIDTTMEMMEMRMRDLEHKMVARIADLECQNQHQAQRISTLQNELCVLRADADTAAKTASRELWDPYSPLAVSINMKIDQKMLNEVQPLKAEVAKLKETSEKLAAINLQQHYSLSAKNTTGITKEEFARLTGEARGEYMVVSDKREMTSEFPSIRTSSTGWYYQPQSISTKLPQ